MGNLLLTTVSKLKISVRCPGTAAGRWPAFLKPERFTEPRYRGRFDGARREGSSTSCSPSRARKTAPHTAKSSVHDYHLSHVSRRPPLLRPPRLREWRIHLRPGGRRHRPARHVATAEAAAARCRNNLSRG